MTKPAFLVEGQMEQAIIQAICPNHPVRLIGCNGDSVSMMAVARALEVHFRLLKNYHPIIILFDRERRTESCDALRTELSIYLDQKNHEGQYVIGMPDRTIENWILADWDNLCKTEHGYKAFDGDPEDCHGKSTLRRLLPRHVVYHETTTGVDLFLKCRPEEIYRRHKSFRDFVSRIQIPCYWLKGIGEGSESICP
jgi:hypothetical protein